MKKMVLLALSGLLLTASSCKTTTCPAYSKSGQSPAPAKTGSPHRA